MHISHCTSLEHGWLSCTPSCLTTLTHTHTHAEYKTHTDTQIQAKSTHTFTLLTWTHTHSHSKTTCRIFFAVAWAHTSAHFSREDGDHTFEPLNHASIQLIILLFIALSSPLFLLRLCTSVSHLQSFLMVVSSDFFVAWPDFSQSQSFTFLVQTCCLMGCHL